jgi:hypothetical protein
MMETLMCGRKNWSLILREEPMLRVLENRVLGELFGPQKAGTKGGLEKTAGRRTS